MPRILPWSLALIAALGLVPLALVARARRSPDRLPRLHAIHDMDAQDRLETQSGSPVFADGRAMRPQVPGTIPAQAAAPDRHLEEGLVPSGIEGDPTLVPATTLPFPATPAVLARGRERYDVVCQPCHGLSGHGDGMVHQRASALGEGTWTPPADLHAEQVRALPLGAIIGVIAQGRGSMPAFGARVTSTDRWAIAAYTTALERSQDARPEDVPPGALPAEQTP